MRGFHSGMSGKGIRRGMMIALAGGAVALSAACQQNTGGFNAGPGSDLTSAATTDEYEPAGSGSDSGSDSGSGSGSGTGSESGGTSEPAPPSSSSDETWAEDGSGGGEPIDQALIDSFPLPEGALNTWSFNDGGEYVLMFDGVPVEDVMAYYETALPASGYEIDESTSGSYDLGDAEDLSGYLEDNAGDLGDLGELGEGDISGTTLAFTGNGLVGAVSTSSLFGDSTVITLSHI